MKIYFTGTYIDLIFKNSKIFGGKTRSKKFSKYTREMSYGDFGSSVILQVLQAYISTKKTLRQHSVIKNISNLVIWVFLWHLLFVLVGQVSLIYPPYLNLSTSVYIYFDLICKCDPEHVLGFQVSRAKQFVVNKSLFFPKCISSTSHTSKATFMAAWWGMGKKPKWGGNDEKVRRLHGTK